MHTVNNLTGEILDVGDSPMLRKLRAIEEEITRADAVVKSCAEALKDAKEERENAVLALRNAVRGQQALPL